MTEAHSSDSHAHGHGEVKTKIYLAIFGALTGFTLISFVANFAANNHWISHFTSFTIILSVAMVKATLVAMYFMHLVFDWGKVFIMIVPALVLGPMLMVVLLPDIVLSHLELVPPPPAKVEAEKPAH
jgi:cytochrome c oxidase subunit 4